jgi:hypothetical protein
MAKDEYQMEMEFIAKLLRLLIDAASQTAV